MLMAAPSVPDAGAQWPIRLDMSGQAGVYFRRVLWLACTRLHVCLEAAVGLSELPSPGLRRGSGVAQALQHVRAADVMLRLKQHAALEASAAHTGRRSPH